MLKNTPIFIIAIAFSRQKNTIARIKIGMFFPGKPQAQSAHEALLFALEGYRIPNKDEADGRGKGRRLTGVPRKQPGSWQR